MSKNRGTGECAIGEEEIIDIGGVIGQSTAVRKTIQQLVTSSLNNHIAESFLWKHFAEQKKL